NKLHQEKIVIETNCPYLTPEPFRGKRKEPVYVKYVAEKIAEIKEISLEQVIEVTTNNAKKIYSI
ncbi:MAG: TatD family hydrolase, partial [Sebaldella sp.]|nr:TatD family hydrolase [Sebaldella sp.]